MGQLNLTDNEIREITKCLDDGKSLPEKYRFLLFEDKREVELVWNGKTPETSNIVLPFQTIEVVDEPRSENVNDQNPALSLFDERGRQISGWTNKLIWGDNKLILSSLRSGPMREEIEKQGGIKLIYIDPPFDVGADFSMKVEVGDDELTKKPNVLEELAYRDTWGKGADSFIAMIYERLSLMKDLLADDGSIYVHCDYRVSGYMRLALEEIFGKNNLRNEIVWCYTGPGSPGMKQFNRKHDTIFWYSKGSNWIFNREEIRVPLSTTLGGGWEGLDREAYAERGKIPEDWWEIAVAARLRADGIQRTGYPTEKPNKFLSRIIEASSNMGDLIADFFCGSGSFLYNAENLGRKWIGADLGKFSIHTTRKRMIGTQRLLQESGADYRAFEILNLGKYERQHYVGVNLNLREEQQQKQLAKKEDDFRKLITRAYKAEEIDNFKTFVAKKSGRLIAIGPINMPASRLFVEEIIKECIDKQITKVDILSFEFEMGLFPKIQEDAKAQGIDMALKYIPKDVFDNRAIERGQVEFHDVSYVEIEAHIKPASSRTPATIAIELTDFSAFYSQDIIDNVIETLKNGSSKVVLNQGTIVKISKDKEGQIAEEVLTKEWTDWIDYWAVDFDFESKREMIQVKNEETSELEEVWTGDYIFENEWQSFKTKKSKKIETRSVDHECTTGKRKIAVKVVDILGNDTMKVVEVNI